MCLAVPGGFLIRGMESAAFSDISEEDWIAVPYDDRSIGHRPDPAEIELRLSPQDPDQSQEKVPVVGADVPHRPSHAAERLAVPEIISRMVGAWFAVFLPIP